MMIPQEWQDRPAESHKGDFGRALLVGGSIGLSGAISLSGMAALRSGAGLVTLAVPASILPIVAGHEPSYMTVPLPDADGYIGGVSEAFTVAAKQASCIASGPGLGRQPTALAIVNWILNHTNAPVVLDADALYPLSPGLLKSQQRPIVVTPHPGEFRAMIRSNERDRQRLEELARDWAAENQVVVLLKGHHALITDGRRSVHNDTGNPGMATGGSGDVLTGMIAAFICQGMDAFDSAVTALHVHGRAGDLAAESLGQMSLIASDLIRFLPAALR